MSHVGDTAWILEHGHCSRLGKWRRVNVLSSTRYSRDIIVIGA